MALLTEALIPIFWKACDWYSANRGVHLPQPASIPSTPINQVDPNSREAFGYFYVKNEHLSKICNSGTMLKGISTHVLPLLAAIREESSTGFIAEVIERHNITVEDIESIYLTRQGESKLFMASMGEDIHLRDAYIEAWKAFDKLGMISQSLNASSFANAGGMHTECEAAWPANVIEGLAKGNLAADGDFLMSPTSVFGDWYAKTDRHLPNGDPLEFIRRSGMLSSAAYRKQLAYHTLWEGLCISAGSSDGACSTKILNACKEASPHEKLIIKDAMRSMHPDRGDWKLDMAGIYSMLRFSFYHSDLRDIMDSVILKINLTVDPAKAANYKEVMPTGSVSLFDDILLQPETILAKACSEVLALRPGQIGFAQLAVFDTIERMSLGEQVIAGVTPEAVIVHLDNGMRDFLGARTKTNQMTEKMFVGMSKAFKMLSRDHSWDYKALSNCSELTALALVRGGAAMGKLPDMGRRKRAIFLEEELGL